MIDFEQFACEVLDDDYVYVTDGEYKLRAYRAPYGDFLKLYFEHLSKPWWRRGRRWRKEETKMRSILNSRHPYRWVQKVK